MVRCHSAPGHPCGTVRGVDRWPRNRRGGRHESAEGAGRSTGGTGRRARRGPDPQPPPLHGHRTPPPVDGSAADRSSAQTHCLYAVYDPVTRRCTAARAGAAGLTVVAPDGDVTSVGPTASDAADRDGYDVAVFDVPPGSLLVLSCAGAPEQCGDAPDDQEARNGACTGGEARLPLTGRGAHVLLTARTRAVPPWTSPPGSCPTTRPPWPTHATGPRRN
ncbi:hypothetical protein E4K10_40360 [Streptomyces sp. T1317-0309]|nr:hypothetical protein E4K10_40360 [Streptomyces sp. T1317-0309]